MNSFNDLKNIKTLLVDDNELVRNALRLVFENNGCLIRAAESAEEGLKALRASQYDLVISDFRLPGMNGLEFLALAASANPRAVKVLITAYRDDFIFSEALRMGIRLFIEKPFTVAKLIGSLAPQFAGNQSAQTL